MPGNYCCVPLCDGRGGHKFPKIVNRRMQWLAAIKRDKWTPTEASVVCRRHFRSSDYRTENTSGNRAFRLLYVLLAANDNFFHFSAFCRVEQIVIILQFFACITGRPVFVSQQHCSASSRWLYQG